MSRAQPRGRRGRWLGRVVCGWFAYFAIPGSMRWLAAFRHSVVQTWLAMLRRRSQKHRMALGPHRRHRPTGFCPEPSSFTCGRRYALPSLTRDRNPVPELGTPGSARGRLARPLPTATRPCTCRRRSAPDGELHGIANLQGSVHGAVSPSRLRPGASIQRPNLTCPPVRRSPVPDRWTGYFHPLDETGPSTLAATAARRWAGRQRRALCSPMARPRTTPVTRPPNSPAYANVLLGCPHPRRPPARSSRLSGKSFHERRRGRVDDAEDEHQ
jgi:hypothetical protein